MRGTLYSPMLKLDMDRFIPAHAGNARLTHGD